MWTKDALQEMIRTQGFKNGSPCGILVLSFDYIRRSITSPWAIIV